MHLSVEIFKLQNVDNGQLIEIGIKCILALYKYLEDTETMNLSYPDKLNCFRYTTFVKKVQKKLMNQWAKDVLSPEKQKNINWK